MGKWTRSLVRRSTGEGEPSVLEAFASVRWWSILSVLLGPVLGVLAYAWAVESAPELGQQGRVMLGILVLAAWYWSTGAIPPFATAVLVMGLLVFLLGVPAEQGLLDDEDGVQGWEQFISPAAAPVVVLMLGGFALSAATHKHGIDRVLALALIKPFGTRPGMVLLGVMLVTANLSMWMSNTATAAMMMTLIAPVLTQFRAEGAMRKRLALAIPIAANVGGVGTPIGTPPNAIAFGALRAIGVDVSFVGWMLFAIPVALVVLAAGWAMLMLVFRDEEADGRLSITWEDTSEKTGWKQWVVYATFTVTVGLWVTSAWTGVPIAPIAIIPIVVFTATRLLDRNDVNRLNWDILLLIAGGLALGGGMEATGLAAWMVERVPLEGMGPTAVVAVLCGLTLAMSTLMSNTAVANLLMPIGLGLAAAGTAAGLTPMSVGVGVALGASFAMGLPVSTPPNAIAYSTGWLRIKHFLLAGGIVALAGIPAATAAARIVG